MRSNYFAPSENRQRGTEISLSLTTYQISRKLRRLTSNLQLFIQALQCSILVNIGDDSYAETQWTGELGTPARSENLTAARDIAKQRNNAWIAPGGHHSDSPVDGSSQHVRPHIVRIPRPENVVLRILFVLIVNFSVAGCAANSTVATETAVLPVIAPSIEAFDDGWHSYTDEINQVTRQTDCAPRMLKGSPEVSRRGAVLMLHGFGGCPQQFFDLAQHIASQGFDVLLPLLPGQGV